MATACSPATPSPITSTWAGRRSRRSGHPRHDACKVRRTERRHRDSASERRLGGQCVHCLCDARGPAAMAKQVTLRSASSHKLRFPVFIDEGDENRAFLHPLRTDTAKTLPPQDDVGLAHKQLRVGHQCHLPERTVRQPGALSRTGLHADSMPQLDELFADGDRLLRALVRPCSFKIATLSGTAAFLALTAATSTDRPPLVHGAVAFGDLPDPGAWRSNTLPDRSRRLEKDQIDEMRPERRAGTRPPCRWTPREEQLLTAPARHH